MTERKTQEHPIRKWMFLNYFSLFLFALKPGSCLNRTQTHKLTVPQQVTWKEGKSWPGSWTIIVDQFGHMGLQVWALGCWIPDHGYYRKNQTTALNASFPTLQGHLSHHINLAVSEDGGWKVKKEQYLFGYRHFLKGGPKILCGGWAQG